MEEKNKRALASEKYRQEHKEYYNEYYKKYRKEKGQKNYYKIYKKRINDLFDYLASHELYYKEKNDKYISCDKDLFDIARGEFDEE
jgi:hypothetical protein